MNIEQPGLIIAFRERAIVVSDLRINMLYYIIIYCILELYKFVNREIY